MKYIQFIFLNLLLTCIYLTALAASNPSNDLVALLSSVQTMQANFTQTLYDNHGKVIQESHGSMAMFRPGKFRWQVTKPIPQLVIANDTKLWIYDEDLEQVTIRSLKKATGETPALLLSHANASLDKEFNIKQVNKKNAAWKWYALTPKKADNMFASIEMGFKNGFMTEMQLKDHLGHTTLIRYKDIQTNLNLSPSLFTFKPPAHVDVINEISKG